MPLWDGPLPSRFFFLVSTDVVSKVTVTSLGKVTAIFGLVLFYRSGSYQCQWATVISKNWDSTDFGAHPCQVLSHEKYSWQQIVILAPSKQQRIQLFCDCTYHSSLSIIIWKHCASLASLRNDSGSSARKLPYIRLFFYKHSVCSSRNTCRTYE